MRLHLLQVWTYVPISNPPSPSRHWSERSSPPDCLSPYRKAVRPKFAREVAAAKHGISVLNAPGTIDADYRGDIGVILINLSQEDFTVAPQDRIAQLVIAQYSQVQWKIVPALPDSERGSGGFGSTGKKD